MIHLTAHSQVPIVIQTADFRCGIEGLAALCKPKLPQDPRNHSLFVFMNDGQSVKLRRLWILINDETVIKRTLSI